MGDGTWLIENSVAELRNSHLLQAFRTKLGRMFYAVSHDAGVTWSEPAPMALQNPNSKGANPCWRPCVWIGYRVNPTPRRLLCLTHCLSLTVPHCVSRWVFSRRLSHCHAHAQGT